MINPFSSFILIETECKWNVVHPSQMGHTHFGCSHCDLEVSINLIRYFFRAEGEGGGGEAGVVVIRTMI